MRWVPGGESRNIEDRRGWGGTGIGPVHVGAGGAVVLLILSLIFGRNFMSGGGASQASQQVSGGEVGQPIQQSPEEAHEVQLVSWVLDTVQATWSTLLPRATGVPWHDAKVVLYRDATQTGCGVGETATGPFYCPVDERVYVDLSFFDELRDRFGAPGEFAQAYVLAHELGHHVQHLLGTDTMAQRMEQADPANANQVSVKVELQADCYAGVWGYYAQQAGALNANDVHDGLNAAAAVGDDRLQRETTGRVNYDTFTHGSSAQRESWFERGLATGDPNSCDTFGTS